jgi:hypothetical protein
MAEMVVKMHCELAVWFKFTARENMTIKAVASVALSTQACQTHSSKT